MGEFQGWFTPDEPEPEPEWTETEDGGITIVGHRPALITRPMDWP